MPVTCTKCQKQFPDGTYLYGGPKTKEKKGADISGQSTRKDLFAAGNYSTIRHNARLGGGDASRETVYIHLVKDSITLEGVFFPPAPNKTAVGAVLILSGSGGTQADYCQPIVDGYRNEGLAVLAVDYRGFGGNDGTPSSRGTYSDAAAMLDYLTAPLANDGRGLATNKVIVHGFSLGSGPATELAKNNPGIAGLVLHCPMASAAENARDAMGGGVTGWLAALITATGHAYDNLKKIPQVTVPIHIITGTRDPMEPQGQKLLAKAVGIKSSHRYNGGHLATQLIFPNATFSGFIQAVLR